MKYIRGNIFASTAQVLVNPVNTEGIMGSGLAFQFKIRYMGMFHEYIRECRSGVLDIGKPTIYKTSYKWILNFPTKRKWKDPSELEYIIQGLEMLVETYQELGIQSIAFPKLGCGYGNLEWSEVKQVMEKYLGKLPIEILIYI